MEIFKLFGSIFIDNDKANESLETTDKKGKGVMGTLGGVIGTATTMGAALAAAGATAAVALDGLAVKAARDFEKGMSNVATLLDGDVKGRIAELGDNVQQMQIKTGASATTLQDGLYQVISALGDSASSMQILETAAKGATAGNATVTDSVNLLAAITKGYGDTSAEAASQASDLAFLTVKLGQTSFPELASSMGKVIPLAATMKVSQEELFGAMATLTGVTGNTAEVTTQLRGTIQGFMQPTKQMTDALGQLGYANGQVALESEGLGGILNKLKDSVGGNEIAFAGLFGSVEAKNAVLALTGSQADIFTEKSLAMKDAVGATDEAFQKQTDNVAGLQARLGQLVNVALTDLGEKLLPMFKRLLDFIEVNIPTIQAILEGFFVYFEVFVDGVSKLIMVVIDWGKKWYSENAETLEAIKIGFMEFFATISDFVQSFITMFNAYWNKYGDHIMTTVKIVWDTVKGVFSGAFDTVLGIFKTFSGLFSGDWGKMWGGIKQTFGGVWDGIVSIGKGAMNLVIQFVNKMIGSLNTLKWEIPSYIPFLGGKSWGFNLSKIPLLAEGGDINRGGMAIVGEAGPELLNLPTGARVTPLNDSFDYDKLAEVLSRHMKPDVTFENHFTPAESTPAEHKRKQQQLARQLALEW